MRPGDIVSLAIERPATGGRMIARHDGQVVFVARAIPGERVRARIERTSKQLAFADAIEVDEPSPDRRDWPGDPACGGCLYAHIAYARQLAIKAAVIADTFARIGRLPLERPVVVAPSPEEGYRMRARLHVRGLRAGFFREGSHELCDPRQTRQLLPATLDVVETIEVRIRSLGLTSVQGIELAENAVASERAIAIDAAAPIAGSAIAQLASLNGLTGVASGRTIAGTPFVTDAIDVGAEWAFTVRRHVSAFFQGNRFLLAPLVAHVVGQIEEGAPVLDLYAGGGLFSIAAARARGARVTAVEGDPVAAADLAANAAGLDAVRTHHDAVEAFIERAPVAEAGSTIVVDPPRTGLSNEAIAGVIRLRPPRLIYVSCDVATLARDARKLVDAGYGLEHIKAFDLFPNTPHVECVVVLSGV
jgi:23S rRNA (uracil1939-C5)-methyltransferase